MFLTPEGLQGKKLSGTLTDRTVGRRVALPEANLALFQGSIGSSKSNQK